MIYFWVVSVEDNLGFVYPFVGYFCWSIPWTHLFKTQTQTQACGGGGGGGGGGGCGGGGNGGGRGGGDGDGGGARGRASEFVEVYPGYGTSVYSVYSVYNVLS